MTQPTHSVTLLPEEVLSLTRNFSTLRHDVNNQLALLLASLEVIQRKPETAVRLTDSFGSAADRIMAELRAFSDQLEKALQVGSS